MDLLVMVVSLKEYVLYKVKGVFSCIQPFGKKVH